MKTLKKLIKTDIFKIINLQFNDIKNNNYKFNIAEILYPDEFQKLILNKNYKSTFKPELYIDILDIIYLYRVNFNYLKIIDYFYKKLLL